VPRIAWICLLHRFSTWRHGKQQNVVALTGATVPVGLTGLGEHPPPAGVKVSRKSPGCWTAAHEKGAMYEMVLPVQVLFVDDDTDTVAEHVAPETLPQEHVVHERWSFTPP
jgi:hypothetical protein